MHSIAFLSSENKASICFVLDCIIPWQILWSMVILHCCNIETLHPLTCAPELITLKFPKETLQWKINRTSKTSSMIWAVKIMSRVYCDSCNIPFFKNIFLFYTHRLSFAALLLSNLQAIFPDIYFRCDTVCFKHPHYKGKLAYSHEPQIWISCFIVYSVFLFNPYWIGMVSIEISIYWNWNWNGQYLLELFLYHCFSLCSPLLNSTGICKIAH